MDGEPPKKPVSGAEVGPFAAGALPSCPLFPPARIHPNLKSTVYCSAISQGGVEEWNFAWRMFQSATLASEASRLRGAMACTRQPWLLNRYVSSQLIHPSHPEQMIAVC